MWPIRMSFPLCRIGGFDSSRFIFSSTFPANHSEDRMCPVTCTWLELPVRTSTSPEPVVKSMCTGPVTCKVRSNFPSAAAAAGKACAQIRVAMAKAPRAEGKILRSFMVSPESSWIRYTLGNRPVLLRSLYCRTTSSPSFNPLSNSVLAPLEMPMLTATFFLPSLAWVSGTSTDAFLSLS